MTMTVEALKEELSFYEEQKPELLKRCPGQYVLIKERELIGVFPTQEEAYSVGFRRFVRNPFLVKRIVDKETPEQVPLLALHIQRAAL